MGVCVCGGGGGVAVLVGVGVFGLVAPVGHNCDADGHADFISRGEYRLYGEPPPPAPRGPDILQNIPKKGLKNIQKSTAVLSYLAAAATGG